MAKDNAISRMINGFRNCFKIPELRQRIIFTLLVLAVCRLIAWVPIPGLDGVLLQDYFDGLRQKQSEDGIGFLGIYSMFTGGAWERCSIGGLGIMPYISATIILQLMTPIIPRLSRLSREEGGRVKIMQIGRVMTLFLCLGQGYVMSLGWLNPGTVLQGFEGALAEGGMGYHLQTMMALTCGTMLLMWLGEQITERGIGNGVSLVITIGIVADLPRALPMVWEMFAPQDWTGAEDAVNRSIFEGIGLVVLLWAVVMAVVAVTQAQRKIPVQHAQRAVGRKVYAGGSSFMPLRVNYSGVMPLIFAQAILMFPGMVLRSLGSIEGWEEIFLSAATWFEAGHPFYYITYALMIMFFAYFWVATTFNEIEIADNLKKNGGYIPGVRPGKATSDFLHKTMSRITFAGASFLVIVAIIPMLLGDALGIPFQVSQFFGGTSILIAVGVTLDTMRQMESYLLMRHYDGFLRKGRVRGRF
ncbi:MAG: preprotein translocase subunit SecY [Verrucomicrobiota bacterium]|nr:preprotein translocase subunit SecY [Verrucomicrobiota bacterium]|tara:strand:+ start:348 stop:1760 length:1413 start_codon:yes stop_codon:yes gene_type:complete